MRERERETVGNLREREGGKFERERERYEERGGWEIPNRLIGEKDRRRERG